MRATLFLVAGLTASVVAHPHRRTHHHHAKRQGGSSVIEQDVVLVLQEVAVEDLIYLDGDGNPTSTGTVTTTLPLTTIGATTNLIGAGGAVPPVSTISIEWGPGPVSIPSSLRSILEPTPPASSVSIALGPGPVSISSVSIPLGPGPESVPPSLLNPAVSTPSVEIDATISIPGGLDPTSVVLGAGSLPTVGSTPMAPPQPASGPASSAPSTPAAVPATPNPAGFGLSYSPYDSQGMCKTQEAISTEVQQMNGYGTIRIYGTDCNQTAMVLAAARASNMQLFAGVYNINAVAAEIQLIVDAAAGDWSDFNTISIGNELVNNGQATVDQVVSALGTARALLGAAGYPGRIVTVDTFVAVKANPALCLHSDYAAVNCHPFFDGGVTAAQAGQFVAQQAQEVSAACGGMETVITETGWPWRGTANGAAVPSIADQVAALGSLHSMFSANVFLLSAFDELWKETAASTFNAERYWGVLGKST